MEYPLQTPSVSCSPASLHCSLPFLSLPCSLVLLLSPSQQAMVVIRNSIANEYKRTLYTTLVMVVVVAWIGMRSSQALHALFAGDKRLEHYQVLDKLALLLRHCMRSLRVIHVLSIIRS